MFTSVANGGYYLKVKQVATLDADQDVVIKAGAVRQINSGVTDISALNGIRLECNGAGILFDQAGDVHMTMGLTGPTHALVTPLGPTPRWRSDLCAERFDANLLRCGEPQRASLPECGTVAP